MASARERDSDWILLSMAVLRMSELDPDYRTRPGIARRDLESAIRAGRIALRGCPVGSLERPPTAIKGSFTTCVIDLFYDSLSERRPGPLGNKTLYRKIELKWPEAAIYLLSILAKSKDANKGVAERPLSKANAVPPANKKARGPKAKVSEKVKNEMRKDIREKRHTIVTLREMPEKELEATYGASRYTVRNARNDIVSENEGNSNSDK